MEPLGRSWNDLLMAPKRQRVASNEAFSSKSSYTKFDSKKFVSLEASQRSHVIAKKTIIKKREFESPEKVVESMVLQRGWETLTQPPKNVVALIIR